MTCRCSSYSRYSACDWETAYNSTHNSAEHERIVADRLRSTTWCLVKTSEKRLHDRQCNNTRKLGPYTRLIARLNQQASGRFVKQEQWERWRCQAEIGVWVPSTGGASAEVRGITQEKLRDCIGRSCSLVHFWPEMVRNAVYNALLNTLTMGTGFPCFPAAILVKQWELCYMSK